MNGQLAKAMRRQARGEAMAAMEATTPAIKGIYENERKTRKRVDDLEVEVDALRRRVQALEGGK
jgi:polyhydroxyalkanoate synthesis regulator phasin